MNQTLFGRLYGEFSSQSLPFGWRLVAIAVLAVVVHVAVRLVRFGTESLLRRNEAQKGRLGFVTGKPKVGTLIRLLGNSVTFVAYFLALGLVLEEMGVNLGAYLASASIVGLAISFGSQGLVQDMVIGLTLIFSDAMDVGDMVEIAGTVVVIGRVEEIGLRFTKLTIFYRQTVFVPNRTIANVSRFPGGGVEACAAVQIPAGTEKTKALETITEIARSTWRRYDAVILSEPVIGGVETMPQVGWEYVRVHFRIWPGQGNVVDTIFRQQMVGAMKFYQPDYADWRVPVTYGPVRPA